MEFKNISNSKKLTGLSYIGQVNNGAKHQKAYKYNELVYTIYFAPANLSGYEVCKGRTKGCTEACLNMSGRNIMDVKKNVINKSRIKKTQLLFEERDFFVRWIIAEIKVAQLKAIKEGSNFSVRLNNTSDISPEEFYIIEEGEKVYLLDLFPEVTFYDYTKIDTRTELLQRYPNYDLTYSFNGINHDKCKKMLENNIRVAVVFYGGLPETYLGYEVISGDDYDMRYKDPGNVIIGLTYKKVRTKLDMSNKFIVHSETI